MIYRVAAVLCFLLSFSYCHYEPTWDSLDARPLPSWYDDAKLGIFIHWGVFSVPSFSSEWFWWYWQGVKHPDVVQFMNNNYKKNFKYAEFGPQFTAEFYNATQWADLFYKSGAKYIVFTSKHHEGFCMWPTNYSWNWNSWDVGPKRDLLGELATAVRNKGLIFGVYHSLFEWFNPLFLEDHQSSYKQDSFVKAKTMPELYELVNTYKPDVIWSDGDWDALDTYWKSKEFLAWLYNDSPVKNTVVVNDRWGSGTACKHGGFLTCADRYTPSSLMSRKWENAMTLDKNSWGFVRTSRLENYLSIEELLSTLINVVSLGGNLLVNVGPTHDGRIVPIMEERLTQLGSWLEINGEAIYYTKPWKYQNDSIEENIRYTQLKKAPLTTVFCHILKWPEKNKIYLGAFAEMRDNPVQKVELLSSKGYKPVVWKQNDHHLFVDLIDIREFMWTWTLKIQYH